MRQRVRPSGSFLGYDENDVVLSVSYSLRCSSSLHSRDPVYYSIQSKCTPKEYLQVYKHPIWTTMNVKRKFVRPLGLSRLRREPSRTRSIAMHTALLHLDPQFFYLFITHSPWVEHRIHRRIRSGCGGRFLLFPSEEGSPESGTGRGGRGRFRQIRV